jgi:TPR repeat protein
MQPLVVSNFINPMLHRTITFCVLIALFSITSQAGMTPEEVKKFKDYKSEAEKGDATAQFNLGACYFYGNGVIKDQLEGVKWFQKATEQGDAQAQVKLGWCYGRGEYVPKDENKALYLFMKAANQGDAKAQYNLGSCYANGLFVARDVVQAVFWYHKAAERGDADAQLSLGFRYAEGDAVVRDEVESYAWFNLAAVNRGHAPDPNDKLNIASITEEIARKQRSEIEKKISQEIRVKGQQRSKELVALIEKNKAAGTK